MLMLLGLRIRMIKLKSLLTEISFGNIKPYVDNIHWTLSGGGYDFMFTDEYDNEVIVNLADQTPFDSDEDDSELELSFFVKPKGSDFHSTNKVKEKVPANYLRIMATVGAGLLAFIDPTSPEGIVQPLIIEFTGSDSDLDKAAQKNRLYIQFARDNDAKFRELGYRFFTSHMGTGIERMDQ